MSSLLDAILGNFNSGSAYVPPNQVPELAADPYGNPIGGLAPGGLAPGVPLPLSRPVEAGPPVVSPPAAAPPDMQPDESGGTAGGLATVLGLDPDRAKTVMASLAGGLSNVKNAPFAGQVAANAAGGAISGGNKADDTAINQALKLQQIQQKAPVIDEETRRAAQADRDGALAQARDAVVRDPSKRAAIIARLQQLGIAL